MIKALKEHIVELSKHEHGHCTVITLIDSVDDTVLLHKVILSEILKNAKDLAVNEWGRKVSSIYIYILKSYFFGRTI